MASDLSELGLVTIQIDGLHLDDQNDEWQTASRYMQVEAFAQIDQEETTPFSAFQVKPPDHDLRPPNLHHIDGHDHV